MRECEMDALTTTTAMTTHELFAHQELSLGEIDPKDVLLAAQFEVHQFPTQHYNATAASDDELDNAIDAANSDRRDMNHDEYDDNYDSHDHDSDVDSDRVHDSDDAWHFTDAMHEQQRQTHAMVDHRELTQSDHVDGSKDNSLTSATGALSVERLDEDYDTNDEQSEATTSNHRYALNDQSFDDEDAHYDDGDEDDPHYSEEERDGAATSAAYDTAYRQAEMPSVSTRYTNSNSNNDCSNEDVDTDDDAHVSNDDDDDDDELLAFIRATRHGASNNSNSHEAAGADVAASMRSTHSKNDDEKDDDDAVTNPQQLAHAFTPSHAHLHESQSGGGFAHSHFTLSAFSTTTDTPQDNDAWHEAYTAKGRVYYYNRRTRESSWKRPENFVARESHASSSSQQLPFARSFASSRNGDNSNNNHSTIQSNASALSASSPAAVAKSPAAQTFLFCMFCGAQTVGPHAASRHVRASCSAAQFHRENRTALYQQFEELLVLLAEDATLRSLHYATSFPAAQPLEISAAALAHYTTRLDADAVVDNAATTQRQQVPVQSSLVLLHRRQSRRNDIRTNNDDAAAVATTAMPTSSLNAQTNRHSCERVVVAVADTHAQSNASTSSSSTAARAQPQSQRRRSDSDAAAVASMTSSSRTSSRGSNSVAAAAASLECETCRYCSRSFAEGRLAKHEAVCPRVFGSESAWGRGGSAASSTQQQQSSPSSGRTNSASRSRSASVMNAGNSSAHNHARRTSKSPGRHRTLALSFREHQAALVRCPVCTRTFAPSGAQQHIDICRSVQNRPKNPLQAMAHHTATTRDYAVAG